MSFLTKRQAAMCLRIIDQAIDRMDAASCNDLPDDVTAMLTPTEWDDLFSRLGLGEAECPADVRVMEAVRREIWGIAGGDDGKGGAP